MQRAAEIVGADVIGIIFRKQVRLAAVSECAKRGQLSPCRANSSTRPFSVTQLRIRYGSSCPRVDLQGSRTKPQGWVANTHAVI